MAKPTYENLEDTEKAALWGSVLLNDAAGRERLERSSPGWSRSTYYRHYNEGVKRLKGRGIIDAQGNLTQLAIDILPGPLLLEMVNTIRSEIRRLHNEVIEYINRDFYLRRDIQSLTEQVHQLASEAEQVRPLRELIRSFEKLQIDENWIRASIALNLVEPAIKKKLEQLGVELPEITKFDKIYKQLREKLREIENRDLRPQLLTPKHFYDMRSKIDHWGHKFPSLPAKQADLIVAQVTEFIDDILS
jgi:hypothetical protein